MKGIFVKIRKYAYGISLLLLTVFASAQDAEFFHYEMAQSEESSTIDQYRRLRSDDAPLSNPASGRTRNVILMIGDGMGFNHLSLARQKVLGSSSKLYVESFPITGIVRTYSSNNVITESAASATALACGIKTNNGFVGMNPDKIEYKSILEVLKERGYRTGLVVTSAVTHATPAAFSSHTEDRNNQAAIAADQCKIKIDVLFGGGRKFYLPEGVETGIRKDGRNLLHELVQSGYRSVNQREELLALDKVPAVGLFAEDRLTTVLPEPSIAEMTAKAIELLSAPSSKGLLASRPRFFLMVEGSQIDWAAHANHADRVVRQILLFDLAVREAVAYAKTDKHTLVVVTADHETGGLVLKDKDGGIDPEWASRSHTASDVPVYAYGPGSEKFSGVLDNTDISRIIAEVIGLSEFPAAKCK